MRTVILIIFFISSITLSAQPILNNETTYGVKGGFITGGTLFVGDFEDDIGTNLALNGFLDYKLAEKIIGGISLDIIRISAFDESENLIAFNVHLKAQIYRAQNNLLIRPNLFLGYGMLSAPVGDDDSQQFNVGLGVEFAIPDPGENNFLFEAGILGSPAGGNDSYDITFDPILFLRGGIVF